MSTTGVSRIRRRTVLPVIGTVALVTLIYAVVVALYASSGHVDINAERTFDEDTVVLRLTPERMDTSAGRLVASILPVTAGGEPELVADSSFSVLVSGGDGSQTIDYGAQQVLSSEEVEFLADGYIERWPFDRYTVTTVIVAIADADGDGEMEPLPTAVVGTGRVPGWNIRAEPVDVGATVLVDGQPVTVEGIVITAVRSGSTVAFGIVLLSLMVVMPVLVLTVAITVYRGRRKVEATLMSWIGAMLFATIPLRNFLPGNPPIGSWVDYLIVLWVIAGLVVGLLIFVSAWLRRGPAGTDPDGAASR